MLTSIDVNFIFDSACLSASLGDKELAKVVQFRKHSPNRRCRLSRCLLAVLAMLTTQPRPQVVLANCSIISPFCCTIDVIRSHMEKFFQIWSTVASYD